MRIGKTLLWLLTATAVSMAVGLSDTAFAAETPPYEVVKDHVDIILAADGTFVETREEIYRPLNAAGVKLLQQRQLTYTRGYEKLDILSAVTRRAAGDGVAAKEQAATINLSYGQGTMRSFFGNDVITLAYANLAVGDCVVLVSRLQQISPWFVGHFDLGRVFSRTVVSHDVVYRLAAPAAMDLHIDTVGLAGGAEVTEGDVKHWLWQFDNSSPVPVPTDAVSEADFAPRLNISTFTSYTGVAAAYRARAAGKAAVSHDIAALATSLTRNTTDRREQARLLYEWVATHIAYIAIELGAGGFTPHSAADVLENRFGDCKDHVVLLEALLAAKGIESSPALIKAGENSYRLADAASPHAFDHVITYVPEFDLFADASDGDAPFGILPYADMGKPVLLASTGQVLRTPVPAGDSEVQIDSTVVVDAAGNATGHSAISAAGAYGITLRHLVRVMDHDKQTAWMHLLVGPEAEGKITGGVLSELQDPYTVTADYRLAQALQFPGPADLPVSLSLRPISFADLAGRGQPSRRGNDYVCPSLRATEKLTLVLPEGSSFSLLPTRATVDVPGIRLRVEYSQPNTSTMVRETALVIDHPAASCTPAYYAQVQEEQQDMVDILGQKIRYRGAAAGAVSP